MRQFIFLSLCLVFFTHCSSPSNETSTSNNHRATPPSKYEVTKLLESKEKNKVQDDYTYQDSIVPTDLNADYFVINLHGAKIYEKPNFNSKMLSKLENGKGIQQKHLQQLQADRLKINEGIVLEGHWLAISEPTQGYIFSTDFSEIRPVIIHYLTNRISLLGEQIGETIYKKKPCTINNEVFEKDEEITHFKNSTYHYESFDGCFDHIYTFKNMKFHEVYHHTINQYSDFYDTGNKIEIDSPIFKEINDNGDIIYEGTGATVDLIFRRKISGYYQTYSYDCT